MHEKSQVESSENQDNANIHHQPFPESVSEEREICTDYNGCHRYHVKHHSYPSVHFSTPSFYFFAPAGTKGKDGISDHSRDCRFVRNVASAILRPSSRVSARPQCPLHPPKAGIDRCARRVRFVPKADLGRATVQCLRRFNSERQNDCRLRYFACPSCLRQQ